MGQSLSSKSAPEVRTVQFTGHLDGNLKIAALEGQVKASRRVLNELQGNLRVALLLKIGDNALTNQARSLDNLQHFVVVPLNQGELESVLGGIDLEDLGLGVPIKAVHVSSLDTDQVYCLIKSADDSIVTVERRLELLLLKLDRVVCSIPIEQRVLDVVQRRVDQNTRIIPGCALDADSLMQGAHLFKSLGDNSYIVLAKQSTV